MSLNLKRRFLTFVAIWTGVTIASLGWNICQLRQSIVSLARTSAEISYDKDVICRKWVSRQGGLYAPVSEMTPPNPYLKVPQRDVTTADGMALTLINPAYMTRQVNEMAMSMRNFQSHITSLNLIRPANYPDPWEQETLKSFARGSKESSSIEMLSGKEYFRYMRPFTTEKSCLKCHGAQGYKEGDIRGGISVSVPMAPLRTVERSRMVELTLAHGFLWIIGFIEIGIGARYLRRQILSREKVEEEMLALSITDQLTGLHNRRGFLMLAEQQLKLSERTKKGVLFFFADLDGMKWINDTLGHKEGDNALIEAATALKETFRESDIIARMGGDEFAVLAIDATEENTEIYLARLQDKIDMLNSRKNREYRLSISVGSSYSAPEDTSSLDELMTDADKRMYDDKRKKDSSRRK